MTFTTQPMAKPFGWQGDKAAHRAVGPYKAASAPDLAGLEPGRAKEFQQGIKDGHADRLKTAAVMVGTYAAIRGVQHWSAWRKHQ